MQPSNVRDRLTEVQRSDSPSKVAAQHLCQVNAMLSMVASVEYPLAGLHGPRMELVRDGLNEMLNASADLACNGGSRAEGAAAQITDH